LADSIARLAQVLPLQHVAQHFTVHWHTVKQIDRRAMEHRLGRMEDQLEGLRQLAIDEFAIEKGHRYVTIVLDVQTKRVVWLARERDQTALTGFFTALGPDRCARIEAVALDMWRAYTKQVRHYCPQAALVYDAFHLIAKYGLEVVDRVRVDETNALAHAAGGGPVREARRVIKGTRWLLLKNATGLHRAERVRLRELLHANRALFTVYVLKEDLKQLWTYRARHAAHRWWRHWRRRAVASRLRPLQRFVATLARHLEGILNHCRFPLHTGVLEGCNNKIKVLKRMAYGYRDDAYFFLKIRSAFPGILR
jgi:transposase